MGFPDSRFPEGQTGAARQTNGLCAPRPCLPRSVDGRAPTLLGGQWEARALLCLPGGHSQGGVQAEAGGAVPSVQGPWPPVWQAFVPAGPPSTACISVRSGCYTTLDNLNNLPGSWKSKIRHRQVQGLVRADPGLQTPAFFVLTWWRERALSGVAYKGTHPVLEGHSLMTSSPLTPSCHAGQGFSIGLDPGGTPISAHSTLSALTPTPSAPL